MSDDTEITELEEQLAEARAQIESLQSAAADAEARAATAAADLKAAQESSEALSVELAETAAARDEAHAELSGLQAQLREAALRYREVRLASAPDVPHDLVPELETIDAVDHEFEAAQRVVGQLREKLERESAEQRRSGSVPAGAPARRAPDTAALSAGEKIRLGLRQLDDRQGR